MPPKQTNPVASVSWNVNFNPNSGVATAKYTTLVITTVDVNQVDVDFFQTRNNLFTNAGVGTGLKEATFCYDAAVQANLILEDAKTALPPIVVISGNRSNWIKSCCDVAENVLNTYSLTAFTDVNDVTAITDGPTPWYYPKRVNDGNRRVYMFVHILEYQKYKINLAGTGINIIGWSLGETNKEIAEPKRGFTTCVGFGATRFATVTFFKNLFATSPARNSENNKIWMVDDDLIFIRNCDTLINLESYMKTKNLFGIGFNGCTGKVDTTAINNEIISSVKRYGNNPVASPTADGGLLQQAVLWDINLFFNSKLNFSPCFVLSGEDVSFSNYLQSVNKPTQVFNAQIFKAVSENDGDLLAERLKYFRDDLLNVLYNICKVSINDTASQNSQTSIRKFIRSKTGGTTGLDPINVLSLAVEQIMALAIKSDSNNVTVFNHEVDKISTILT